MIPFVKASACGNDFLIIEENAFAGDRNALTRRFCQRTEGIGADGIEWVSSRVGNAAEVRARLINADGSDAEISGNGTRCVAAWMVERNPQLRSVCVGTGAGARACALVSISGQSFRFSTDMGAVKVGSRLRVAGVEGLAVDPGNPQFVVLAARLPGDWREIARRIQAQQRDFPAGVNVGFAIVETRQSMKTYFYERGAGETQSSGTGSCAAAAAAHRAGLIEDVVEVHAPGGTQTVEFRGDDVVLTGTADIICRGEAYL